MQTAFDPQQALYGRTQQQLQDQVRAGQGARGLGNSAVGAGLEDQAMGNFNIDWQNQQLARQTQGMSAMAQGSQAGGAQGQLGMAAGAAQPGYTMQAGQVPMQAQQYAAAQPGAAASTYQGQMSGLQSQYGNVTQGAIPYMNAGVGAQQQNYQNQAQQNTAQSQMLGNLGSAIAPAATSWLSNAFGGGSSGSSSGSANAWNVPTEAAPAPASW